MEDTHQQYHEAFNPYFQQVFWLVFLTFIILTLITGGIIFFTRTTRLLAETKTSLEQVAISVSNKIPVSVHESLVKPEQQNSDGYKQIEAYFQSVMDGNTKIEDIYTLRPTAVAHKMIFVASGDVTRDKNGNGVIEPNEEKAYLTEEYDTSPYPQLEQGLQQPSVDQNVGSDKWGTWLSGYAPLKDANGKSIAVVGVDLSAGYLNEQRNEILWSILKADLFVLPLFILVALWISRRISRPFKILAGGMDRVTHHDFDYRLPMSHKGVEKIFASLFNSMVESLKHSSKDSDKK